MRCSVYTPENSAYAAESPYSEIEEELWHLTDANNCTSVIMFGDYNSRVRNMQDFELPDIDIFKYNHLSEMYEELRNDLTWFEQNSRFDSLQRKNPDGGINSYGYRLIDFCCENSLYIMNGRTTGNSSTQNTCKNVSTIDYFLMSPSLFQYVNMLTVYGYCELFSDAHCAVSMVLNISHDSSSKNNSRSSVEKTKLWDEEKRDIFINNLDDIKLNSVLSKINEIENSQGISQSDVNCIAQSLTEVFKLSSKISFGSVTHSQSSENKPQHWFNRKCKVARNDFHRAKYLYTSRQTDANIQRLKTCSKIYKRTLATEVNLFKLSKIKQLRKIKTAEPRKFWKFLNGNKKAQAIFQSKKCFDFFKNINSCQDEEDVSQNFAENKGTNTEYINKENLNGPILCSEIEKSSRFIKE